MGAVYGVSLKYVALSALAGVGVRKVTHDTDWLESAGIPQIVSFIVLSHVCLVNGAIAVLFNLGTGMSLIGKDPLTGAVPLWSYVALPGFHWPTWLYTTVHHMKDKKSGVPPATEVEPGWWVGGRYANELGRQWAGTVDLTCEFPEGCRSTTEQYLLLRCWDGVPPSPEMLERAADFAVTARARGDVLVHCAHGRGRSTTVMCACLVRAGLHGTWEAALEAIRGKRRVVKLNRSMRSVLTAWQARYVDAAAERAPSKESSLSSSSRMVGFLRRARSEVSKWAPRLSRQKCLPLPTHVEPKGE
eukprot:TRINITY_DN26889_c0_g3_i2.p1 TRINITY_DN26889_c0_g3~~TRINITY_DN26889_c0_g3_i2.p1  ORF type:complete len:311 (-),score=43.40 TRINITY_DN26889_c0_g3_i2:50-955(-)